MHVEINVKQTEAQQKQEMFFHWKSMIHMQGHSAFNKSNTASSGFISETIHTNRLKRSKHVDKLERWKQEICVQV